MATQGGRQKSVADFRKSISLILEAKKEDTFKRTRLERLLSETAVCLNGMEEKVFSIIDKENPGVLDMFKERIEHLQEREYCILFTGESSSGKSSLINLLLGEDLLPCSTLSTTSTICEIKYGTHPQIVAHFNTTNLTAPTLPPKVVELKNPDVYGKSYQAQIGEYVNRKKDREEGSNYEKVEIFWPHALLQSVMVIDSPGVGENDQMDQMLLNYLPKAFAFIYVINCANAGGIQKDRLVKILAKVRALESKNDMNSDSLAECALFVANKWDQVPKCEKIEVKEYIVDKLTKVWKDGDPQKQTVYISTAKAREMQKSGETTEEFHILLEGLTNMILKAMYSRLHNYWTWLNVMLERIIFKIEGYNKSMLEDRKSLIENMKLCHAQILRLEGKNKVDLIELRAKMQEETEVLVSKLFYFLRSPEFRNAFTNWNVDEVPNVQETWQMTKDSITKALKQRFEKFLNIWDEENGFHGLVHDELVKCFLEKFRVAEAELRDIEYAIHRRHSHASSDVSKKGTHFSFRAKVILSASSPLWITLGVASLFVGLPVIAPIFIRRTIRGRQEFDNYRNEPNAYLTERSHKFIDSIREDQVRIFVKDQMHAAETMLNEYESRIPRMLNANKRMVCALMNETRSKDDVWRSNSPIVRKCCRLQNQSSKFGLLIWPNAISTKQLKWSKIKQSFIGEGHFSSVYFGTLEFQDDSSSSTSPLVVAVKAFKSPLDFANVNHLLKNEAKLRELHHPFICKFFGATVLPDVNSEEERLVATVMEVYAQNLRNVVFSDDYIPPAIEVDSRSPAIQRFLNWSTQLADALRYIHKLKLVHKHVKLENILVAGNDSVKLSDIGFTGQDDVTETNMIYCAPEILQSNQYSSAGDMYSFGLALWEIWDRSKVFSEISHFDKPHFIEKIVDGHRPQPPHHKIILSKVQTVFTYCWAGQKGMRLTASQCYTTLLREMKEIRNS